ncbi:MAG: lipid A export permease/ATP-binding protein MsbA [Gammaproteobacteria bacterium]|nr:lipid A export permease/ATP-binding protein MsbA [Gammaproteobacteria bacterium]
MSNTTSKSNSDQDTSGLSVYLRLLKYLKNYKLLLVLAVIGLAVVAACQLAFTLLLGPIIDEAFVADGNAELAWIPLTIAVIFIVRSVGSFLGLYYIGSIGQRIVKVLRTEMHEKLLYFPSSYYDSVKLGSTLSKFTFDVERVSWAASKSIPIIVRDTLTVIFLIGLMFYLSWKLTLVLFISAPLVYVVIRYATLRFRKLSHRIQTSTGDITSRVEESVSAQALVKLFTAESEEISRFELINEKNRRNQTKFVAVKAINTPLVQMIVGIAFAVVIYVAFMPSVKGDLTAGSFASFVAAVMGMLNAARKLTTINQILQAGIAASESVFNLIDQPAQNDKGLVELDKCRGEIEFNHVSFQYPSKPETVLTDVNLSAKSNQLIAFVGKSGSGKSSLVKLIPRFYEIKSGEIKIDGHLIGDISLKSLRNNISMVSQDVILFNDTIENNIAYAMPNKTRQDVIKAAEQAHAAEFIEKLPEKYETRVGDKGLLLSGGQRQRIAIARALLKDAPILILDEATSSLDSESEYHIQEALNELRKHRTTFVIAHRLSTIESADEIYVMDQGKVVERGSHTELVNKNGEYANLYHRQFKKSSGLDV